MALPVRAIVVGGGIGGLSAAIALRQVGLEAVVFEKAGELREIGAGISLWANAMKALRKLGLYETVLVVGKPLHPKASCALRTVGYSTRCHPL